jgi:hypothetical protein
VAVIAALLATLALGVPSPGAFWQPAPGTTWEWQITGRVEAPFKDVAVYDIDLQDAVPTSTVVEVPGFGSATWRAGINAGVVDELHAAGKKVICYINSGAYETYRPDAALFPRDVILNDTGWSGESWLDIRPGQWQKFAPIIWARFKLAADIGCDAVEPDQNDPVGNDPGAPITLADEKAWYLKVAEQAHAAGLSVGMKNGLEPEVLDADTVAAFDWSLNEECFFYEECDRLRLFTDAGKAVFQTEYTIDWQQVDGAFADPAALRDADVFCTESRNRRFSTLIKVEVPDDLFVPCW